MNKVKKVSENKAKVLRLRTKCKKLKKAGDIRGVLRTKALIAIYQGEQIETVARCYDVSVKSLKRWQANFEEEERVSDQPRSGRPATLSKEQSAELKEKLKEDNQRVWIARHVHVWLATMFGVTLSVKYLPALLRKLGFSYQKAVHLLVKRNNEKRRAWIQSRLPAIYADHIREGWRIFYQDEVGFQTEGTLAHTWAPRGEKVQIKNFGRHGRVNLIGAFELGTGLFHGVLTSFRVNAQRFRRFILHLKREMRTDKILLICDNAPFHKAKWLHAWVTEQRAWLRLEFLPGYSPDFNPIERLWRWMKTEYTHNQCWDHKAQLKQLLTTMLHELPDRAHELRGLMLSELQRLRTVFSFYHTPFVLAPFVLPDNLALEEYIV